MLIQQYGVTTPNTSREERWKETERQQSALQQQTHTTTRSPPCKKDRIVYIENASNVITPFVVQEVNTVHEVLEKIFERYPPMQSEYTELRLYNQRFGTVYRQQLQDYIPEHQENIFVRLYLRKHPPLPKNKIE